MELYESHDLDQASAIKAINRCAQAYFHVLAELAPNAGPFDRSENREKARQAFLAQLPVLLSPGNFQIFIACIGQGVAIGAIDIVDSGRYCHLALTAMHAWKVAHPQPRWTSRPPSASSNQEHDDQSKEAAALLPSLQTQDHYFKELRRRGLPVPTAHRLRNNPDAALAFCALAEQYMDKFPPPENEFGPRPAQEWLQPPDGPADAA